MKSLFQKTLAEYNGDYDCRKKHRLPFVILYLQNGAPLTASGMDHSGDSFTTSFFRLEDCFQHSHCVTLIPVDPCTHLLSTKTPITVDLRSICGFQLVKPEQIVKTPPNKTTNPLKETPPETELRENKGLENSCTESNETMPESPEMTPEPYSELEGDPVHEVKEQEADGATVIIPFDKIKMITIKPDKEK